SPPCTPKSTHSCTRAPRGRNTGVHGFYVPGALPLLTPLKCTRTTEFTELDPGRRSTHQAATERTPGPVLLARPTGRPLTGVRQLSHLSHVVSCCLTNPPICGERAVAPTRARAPARA